MLRTGSEIGVEVAQGSTGDIGDVTQGRETRSLLPHFLVRGVSAWRCGAGWSVWIPSTLRNSVTPCKVFSGRALEKPSFAWCWEQLFQCRKLRLFPPFLKHGSAFVPCAEELESGLKEGDLESPRNTDTRVSHQPTPVLTPGEKFSPGATISTLGRSP